MNTQHEEIKAGLDILFEPGQVFEVKLSENGHMPGFLMIRTLQPGRLSEPSR